MTKISVHAFLELPTHQGSQRLHQGRSISQVSSTEIILKLSFQQQLSQKLHLRRKLALQRKRKQDTRILPFVTQYRPSVPNLKQNWHLMQQQPLLRRIFKYPPIFSYKRGRSLNKEVTQFIEQANSHHLTIKFTAEVSDTETTFLDKNVYKGERFAQ